MLWDEPHYLKFVTCNIVTADTRFGRPDFTVFYLNCQSLQIRGLARSRQKRGGVFRKSSWMTLLDWVSARLAGRRDWANSWANDAGRGGVSRGFVGV